MRLEPWRCHKRPPALIGHSPVTPKGNVSKWPVLVAIVKLQESPWRSFCEASRPKTTNNESSLRHCGISLSGKYGSLSQNGGAVDMMASFRRWTSSNFLSVMAFANQLTLPFSLNVMAFATQLTVYILPPPICNSNCLGAVQPSSPTYPTMPASANSLCQGASTMIELISPSSAKQTESPVRGHADPCPSETCASECSHGTNANDASRKRKGNLPQGI